MTSTLIHADCREAIRAMPDNSIDSCVCDPPYALVSIVKRFAKTRESDDTKTSERVRNRSDGYSRLVGTGFMGEKWDTGDVAHDPGFWMDVMRVLKPGAYLLAFGGTRTYHRLACAIEDAGFEIRDQIAWLYGSGFPKSHDVSKGIDKKLGYERDVVLVDAAVVRNPKSINGGHGIDGGDRPWMKKAIENGFHEAVSDEAVYWRGWGTALKPSQEPLVFARKPLSDAAEWVTIGKSILSLWSRLWLMLPANAAAEFSALNPSAYGVDVSASAQWSADDASNTRADLCAQMDMSQFVKATISSLSTASSWSGTLAESSGLGSTSTIGTKTSQTIDLRILKSFLSKITPESIILAHKPGAWSSADAGPAERYLSASVATLRATLELSALAPAIDAELHSYLDVGATPLLRPICLARTPLSEKTVAANVLKWGTGAINIDGCRVETDDIAEIGSPSWGGPMKRLSAVSGQEGKLVPRTKPNNLGRWPANVIHDGSDEVLAAFPNAPGQIADAKMEGDCKTDRVYGKMKRGNRREGEESADKRYTKSGATNFAALPGQRREDKGSAARFFYCPKASKSDRNEGLGDKNLHPTVKPTALMRYLCRLVTPPSGTILDPFMGSGSTGKAAIEEGFNFIGIEREEKYFSIAQQRIGHAEEETDTHEATGR